MLYAEIKKVNRHCSGISVILILILVSLILVISELVWEQQANQPYYQEDMRLLEGPLTEEKISFLEAKNSYLDKETIRYKASNEDLYNGSISYDEFKHFVDTNSNFRGEKLAFKRVWDKYNYVFEEPANRYFMRAPLRRFITIPKLTLLVGTAWLIVSYLELDKREEVRVVLKVYLPSTLKYLALQVFICTAYVAISVLLIHGLELLGYVIRYGASFMSYPLQSIGVSFSNLTDITVGEALLRVFIIRLIAHVFVCNFLILLMGVTNNKSLSLICLGVFLFLDYAVASQAALSLPFSIVALLSGAPALGTYSQNIIIALMVNVIFLIGAFCIRYRLYYNYHSKSKMGNFKYKMVFLILVSSLFFTACSPVEVPSTLFDVEMLNRNALAESEDSFYVVNSNLGENVLLCIDKRSGEVEEIFIPLFFEEDVIINQVDYFNEVVYLHLKSDYWDYIVSVDPIKNTQKVILAEKHKEILQFPEHPDIEKLGQLYFTKKIEDFVCFQNELWVQDSINPNYHVLQQKFWNKRKPLATNNLLARDNTKLYFKNKYEQLCAWSPTLNELEVLYDGPMEEVLILEETIVFQDAEGLWILNRNSGEKELLEPDIRVTRLCATPSYFIYTNRTGYSIHIISREDYTNKSVVQGNYITTATNYDAILMSERKSDPEGNIRVDYILVDINSLMN